LTFQKIVVHTNVRLGIKARACFFDVFCENACKYQIVCLSLQPKSNENMSYTKKTLVINNPSDNVLEAVEKLRKNKQSQLEKLRKMKPEDFSRRVILA
jgi:hypothetical protein